MKTEHKQLILFETKATIIEKKEVFFPPVCLEVEHSFYSSLQNPSIFQVVAFEGIASQELEEYKM